MVWPPKLRGFAFGGTHLTRVTLGFRFYHSPGRNGGDTGVRVEMNGAYIALWEIGSKETYHWGIFIATSNTSGVLFHQALVETGWEYIIEDENVATSRGFLAAVKLGVLPGCNDEWINMMKSCIRDTRLKDGGEFTCRTWALAAIYEMASGGLIGLAADWQCILAIEKEVKKAAADALLIQIQIVTPSELITD